MVWKELRAFLRPYVFKYLGISIIESYRISQGEQDRVFRLSLEELAKRKEKMQIDPLFRRNNRKEL